MRAVVIRASGGPEVLKLETLPLPRPRPGEVLIRVKAFGLNRSELFTRRGHSLNMVFARVLGIEAAGIVEAAPGGEFAPGTVVATAMGGMGRAFDGGYAEFTVVPATQVQPISVELPWAILGAIPEMLQTAWGSLFKSLRLKRGDRLLIRGGTTSVGLVAAAIAHKHGAYVAATTRQHERAPLLRANGADQVFIDTGTVADQVCDVCPGGFDKVLETGRRDDSSGFAAMCTFARDRMNDRYGRQPMVLSGFQPDGRDSDCGEPDDLCRRGERLHADAAR